MSLYDDPNPYESEYAERDREEFLMWRRQIGEQEFWLMCLSGLPTDDSFGTYEYEDYEEYVP